MSDIFYEIKEAIQKERVEKILKMIRIPIIVILSLILVGSGIFSYIENKNRKKSFEDQDVYFLATDSLAKGNIIDALQRLNNLIENGSPGYVQLALLLKSGISLNMDNKIEFIECYDLLMQKYKNFSGLYSYAINFNYGIVNEKKVNFLNDNLIQNGFLELSIIRCWINNKNDPKLKQDFAKLESNNITKYVLLILIGNALRTKVYES